MRFYLSNETDGIDRNHPLWKKNLPVGRHGARPGNGGLPELNVTYGEYFSAAEAFIRSVHDDNGPVCIPDPEKASVHLEKHGAFYHPSRIAVSDGEHRDAYVLNVAFSHVGRQYLKQEYRTLAMLEKKYAYPFLPRVFACREISVDDTRSVVMFLGEWFAGYHEFHLADERACGRRVVRVWDPADQDRFLSLEDARHLYARAAMILTACYDIQTSDQVSAWHHAAGDFVVNLGEGRKPGVKLVTVRRYGPLLAGEADNAGIILNGLLLFLFNLSIHMRLDRVDGVKAMGWIDDFIVPVTLDGFFEGLALQCRSERLSEEFVDGFETYLAGMTAAEMLDLFQSIGDRLPSQSPDRALVADRIARHSEAFFQAVRARR